MNQIEAHLKKFLSGVSFNLGYDLLKTLLIYVALPTISIYFGKEILIKILAYEIKIWTALLIILALYSAIKIYIFQRSKAKHNFVKYDLKWITKIKGKRAETQGPFCTQCGYQLSDKDISKNNQCPKCFKNYHINEYTIEDLRKKANNIVEADLHVGNVLNLDWYPDGFPDNKLTISNNGSFIVKNIDIEININIKGKQYNVDTYHIDNIFPDERELLNPMVKINEILNNLKLIKTEVDSIEEFLEDDSGNEFCTEREIQWTELVKEFSCKINVSSTYLFRNERKSTNTNYLLKFTYKDTPSECYVDNCTIFLTKRT